MSNRKELIERQKKIIFAKDIVTKNPSFERDQINELWALFNLFADNFRKADIAEMCVTAKTLGLHSKFNLVFEALFIISQQVNGEWVDFETFLTLLTEKLGTYKTQQGRAKMFQLVDAEGKGKLTFSDLKKLSHDLGYNDDDKDIQQLINNISGGNKKEVSYDDFEKFIAKKQSQNPKKKG